MTLWKTDHHSVMMYRLLKDLINWKCNFHIKCKFGKFRYATLRNASAVTCLLFIIASVNLVNCSNLVNNLENGGNARTFSEHGLFRHDNKYESIPPPASEISGSNSNLNNNDRDHHLNSANTSPPDNRDRYTYDRFKRSVTSVNFHPKPKNSSSSASSTSASSSSPGVKNMRVFKYVTEDETNNPDTSHHETIFNSYIKNESDPILPANTTNSDSSHSIRVVGGAKVNLKAKFEKGTKESDKGRELKKQKNNQFIKNGKDENNHDEKKVNNQNESKSLHKNISPVSKPENILIFKPTLALRKTSVNNKTSLIPSGKYKLNAQHHINQKSQVSNGASNSITAAVSTKHPQQQDHLKEELIEEESTDPNSSTVNDRSLIHNFFDSVVVLNEEEGQKELLRQGAAAATYHREKTSNSEHDDVLDNGVGSVGVDDDDDEEEEENVDVDEIKSNMSEPNPFENHEKTSSNLGKIKNAKEEGKEHDLAKKEKHAMSKSVTKSNSNSGSSTKVVIQKMTNKSNGGHKDKMIVKVVKKSKRGKNKETELAEDDVAQDGSERSRRSMPFAVTNKKIPQISQRNKVVKRRNPEQLAREALFRRNTVMTMMTPQLRQMNPAMTKKIAVVPRVLAPGNKNPLMARAILPMKPIPVMTMRKKRVGPHNLALIPTAGGPLGPGPVGPPIAAIKVMPRADSKNLFLQPPLTLTGPNPTAITNPSAPPLPVLPAGKDLMADASRTLLNYRAVPESAILNQAASSYYSPTYQRFQNKFQNKISNIMDSGKEIEDTINQWEESRMPSRHHPRHHPHHRNHPHSRARSRDSGRHRHHRHPHGFDRPRHRPPRPHSTHRSGAHSLNPYNSLPNVRGKKLGGPKYTYPKNAENIQDILSYFDKEVPTPHARARDHPMERTGPVSMKQHQRQHSSSSLPANSDGGLVGPVYPKLADLSGEFRDVHASLLKDIKEFAKRPHMFGSSSHRRDSFRRESFESFVDPIDDMFNPKPLPVRDMIKPSHGHDHHGHGHGYDKHHDIKPDLYSLENIRERIAFKRGKLGGRHRDKDENKDIHSQQSFGFLDDPPHTEPEDYDSQRSSRYNSGDADEMKTSLFSSKEDYDNPSSYTKIGKYSKHDSSSDDSLYPASHYKDSHHHDHDSTEFSKTSHQSHVGSTRKPVVLKRPSSESFRVKEESSKKLPGNDYYYNTFTKKFEKSPTTVNLDSPLLLKTPPQQTPQVIQPLSYQAFQAAATHAMTKPISVEEDIVEIHTGNPSIQSASGLPTFAATAEAHLKQEKLKKMYMDVLQQKMQLEAALLQPQGLPSTLQHHHPQLSSLPGLSTMHAATTYQPQHTPLSLNPQLSHLGFAQQIPSFTSPTIAPLTGLSSLAVPRRKKPMRMKIHIYPNGNDDGIQQGLEAANLLAAGGFGASGFSASNPPPSVVPAPMSKDLNKMSESAIPSGPTGPHITSPHLTGPHLTSPSGYGASAPPAPMPGTVGSVVKNKNVVLHLHVHRRNDGLGPLELETEGSHTIEAKVKPPPQLTYKQIYDEQVRKDHDDNQHHETNLQNHRMMVSSGSSGGTEEEEEPSRSPLNTSSTQEEPRQNHHQKHHHRNHEEEEEAERDKSLSFEAPTHDDTIDNVFHSIMKLRKKPNSGIGTLVETDKRKKRNRN